MTSADARALIAHPSLSGGSAQTWADLGCGDGTFTLALASQLQPGSIVHAMDLDAASLRRLPRHQGQVEVVTHAGDFTQIPWPFDARAGALMANSLHYVPDQPAFLRRLSAELHLERLLLVEYDTGDANPWVPYPVRYSAAIDLCAAAGYHTVTPLGRRRSVYRRVDLYAALFDIA